MRKIIYFLMIIGLVTGAVFLLKKPDPLSNAYCAFCDPAVLTR